MIKRFIFVFGILVLWSVPATSQPKHERVIWTQNPDSEATIAFTTTGAKDAVVGYGLSHSEKIGGYDTKITEAVAGKYRNTNISYHHARLTDLKPSTKYYFRVQAFGKMGREFHFVTAPDDDRPFRILYGGDSRTNVENRKRVNKHIGKLVDADPGLIAFAHGGDYITIADVWGMWDQWLTDHVLIVGRSGRMLPIIPARGNHEGDGVVYNQVFGFPGSTPSTDYWRTQIGSDLVWITLDSNTSLGGDQKTFLEQTLKDAQAHRWIVANYHRPAFPAVKSVGPAYEHFVPLFEKYNADFICESDGHVLKRTVPIRNGLMDPTGVVYLGEGGLGVAQRTPDLDRWYLRPPGMALSAHHVQLFSFSPDSVEYRAVGLDGKTLDTYSFKPKRVGKVAPPHVVEGKFDTSRLTLKMSETLDPDTVVMGNLQVRGPNRILSMNYNVASDTIDIDLGVDPVLPVVFTVRKFRDLGGQMIDQTEVTFAKAESTGVIKRTEGHRPEIETLGVAKPEPKSKPAAPVEAIKPVESGCCSTTRGPKHTVPVLMLFFGLLVVRRRS